MEGHGADAARALARDAAHRLAAEPGRPADDVVRRRLPGRRAPARERPLPRRRRGAVRGQAGRRRQAVRGRARASRRRRRRRPSRGRAGASATRGPPSARRSCATCSTRSTATCAARASWRGSRPSPTRSPRPSTRRAGRSPAARRAHPTVQTLLGAERRDRYDADAPDMRFTVARRDLRARRLPADRGRDGGGRRLRDRGGGHGAPTPTSGRCSPSGASPRSRPPRRSRPTARRGSSSSTPTRARTPCRPRCRSCGCWPARRSAAAPGGGYARAGDVARRRARTPRRSAAGPRPCGGRTASTPRRRPGVMNTPLFMW